MAVDVGTMQRPLGTLFTEGCSLLSSPKFSTQGQRALMTAPWDTSYLCFKAAFPSPGPGDPQGVRLWDLGESRNMDSLAGSWEGVRTWSIWGSPRPGWETLLKEDSFH